MRILNRTMLYYCLFCFLCSCDNISIKETNTIGEGKFSGITISIIGDSISSFRGYLVSDNKGYVGDHYSYYYPHGDVQSVDDTWWAIVANRLGLPLSSVNNCSWSSSTVTGKASALDNAFAGCSIKRIQDLKKEKNPDIILCFISCNDWGSDVPIGSWTPTSCVPSDDYVLTFRDAYALMLYRIIQSYPYSKVFCLTNLEDIYRDRTPGWPSNNSYKVSVDEWNKNIKEIATVFNAQVIDIHDCGITYDNIMEYVVDGGVHPNKDGMRLIANKVVNDLVLKF